MVNIGVTVREIEPDREYEGTLTFDGTKFDYRFQFKQPLDALPDQGTPSQVLEQVDVSLSLRGRPVNANFEAKRLVMATVGATIMDGMYELSREGALNANISSEHPEYQNWRAALATA